MQERQSEVEISQLTQGDKQSFLKMYNIKKMIIYKYLLIDKKFKF